MPVYSLLLMVALVVGAPYWLLADGASGRYRAGFGGGWGGFRRGCGRPADGEVVWVHAVSVGEVLAVAALVELLRERAPGSRIFVSTTTDTGQALARKRFGEENVFYFPLDFAICGEGVYAGAASGDGGDCGDGVLAEFYSAGE